ncbi:MAG: rod shape-determining protein MreD [Candidatus Symbiodolus clandestinus]
MANSGITVNEMLRIVLTLALALVLQVSPWPAPLAIVRDAWVPLVLIYWVLAMSDQINIGTGFTLGLLWDAQLNGILGTRALALSLLAYGVASSASQWRTLPLIQQTAFFTLSMVALHGVILGIESFMLSTGFRASLLWNHAFDGLLWLGFSLLIGRLSPKKLR